MREHRVHAAAVALLLGLAGTVPAEAARTARRVGVVVSTAVNVSPAEGSALAEKLGAALAAEVGIDPIAGAEAERRLPAGGLPGECVASAECRTDIARRLDADELIFLVVVKVGDRIQIDPTWTDAATARVTSRPAIVLDDHTDIMDAFRKAAPGLLPHLQKDGPDIVVVNPGSTSRRMTRPAWIAVGVGAVALAAGVAFGLSARSKHNELDGTCGGAGLPPCAQSDIDSLRNRALAADILYGVGAAAGITALVLYLRSETSAEATPVTVKPATAGLVLEWGGRF